MLQGTLKDAMSLFMKGSIALAKVEHNGIRIDVDYLNSSVKKLTKQISELEEKLKSDKIFYEWRKRFGRANLGSREQLAVILFDVMRLPPPGYTARSLLSNKKRYKIDEEVLNSIDLPFIRDYISLGDLKGVKAKLEGIKREEVDGFIHPFFNLAGGGGDEGDKGGARTYRSCIAKGTLIEVVRDVSKYPKGIPIEEVKEGDYAYCYDDNLNLVIRKVLWTGKTGERKIIRIHWSARGKHGYLDLTPEHEVRLANGKYVEARYLEGKDYRTKGESKRNAKIRTLALGRVDDRLYITGDPIDQPDHRLVYKNLIGPLTKDEVVHHKDHNHLNNDPTNLQKMTKSEHAKHHVSDNLTDEARRRGNDTWREKCKRGEVVYPKGADVYNWINLTRFQLLRMLSKAGGRSARTGLWFGTIKSKAKLFDVDLKVVKDRYDKDGKYISVGKLKRLYEKGMSNIHKVLGANPQKVKRLLKQRGIEIVKKSTWHNRVNNHKITKVEWINRTVDVYDIEVEEHHNFIANEICVHNSSQSPNFQSLHVRDKFAAEIIRSCFIPREGCVFTETDFSALEFGIAASWWNDPVMIEYASDPKKDIHRDIAAEIFLCALDQVTKKEMRYLAKNGFVFPVLYGSYYVKCAIAIWEGIEKYRTIDDKMTVKAWLRKKGIKELGLCDPRERPVKGTFEYHVKTVEDNFYKRFSTFASKKESWWNEYKRKGEFSLMTGFIIKWGKGGTCSRNNLLNDPIQGPGFHCLLWSLIKKQRWLREERKKTLICAQVHDNLLEDTRIEELQESLTATKRIMTVDLPKAWKWIKCPMRAEVDVTPLTGGSWWHKEPWNDDSGIWQKTAK